MAYAEDKHDLGLLRLIDYTAAGAAKTDHGDITLDALLTAVSHMLARDVDREEFLSNWEYVRP